MDFLKRYHEWIPALVIVIILAGSLPYKFSGPPITVHIFNVVGEFLGLDFFKTSGAYIIGFAELVASILVLIPSARGYGGVLAMGIMAGAISFHLFSPLGVTVVYMENGVQMTDGTLFYTAVLTFFCGTYLAYRHKESLPVVGSMFVK